MKIDIYDYLVDSIFEIAFTKVVEFDMEEQVLARGWQK